ncbi:MAG: hypothetical protein KGI63_13425, partial [Xanthomonadaceae bacterium]|nr:hypothetical protein [Xanthomonadaceae bacterium]
DLELTAAQRTAADSIWDGTNCAIATVYEPMRPTLDSIRDEGRRRFRALLNPDQLGRLTARLSADSARRAHADSTRRAHGDSTRHGSRSPNSRQDACKQK